MNNPITTCAEYPVRRLLWPLVSVAVVLGGCTTPINPKDDAEFQSYASATNRPANRPIRSMSSFSDSLMCMDRMMREAEIPTTLIASKQIPDYSGRVPVAAKDMVITALSQMSRLSNAFRYVDFEVDIARQDTVQNLTTLLLNNNQMQLQRPALYVSGAVSFVDQNVLSNRHAAGVSGDRVEAGYSRNRGATIIGMEMHLGDFRTRTLIPGLDSANEVTIGNSGQGLDLAGKIGSYGIQFNVGRDFTQGSGAAIRTLVELAMIELAGKWTRLPYWRCLTVDSTNPEFQRQLREWYEQGDQAVHRVMVQRYLASQGYLPTLEDHLPINSPVLKEAIGRFQTDTGMVVTGELNFATYEKVMRDFVGVNEAGQLARIGWPDLSQGKLARATLSVNLQIENTVKDRTTFESGTHLFTSVTVSRSAYLYCYLQDANKNVIRLLPNMVNQEALVSANQAIRLPDWMVPYPAFIMEARAVGNESLMCLASAKDPYPHLPPAYQVPALTVIQDIHDLSQVREHFSAAVGSDELSADSLNWRVTPKRERATNGSAKGNT